MTLSETFELRIDRKKIWLYLAAIMVFGLLIRLLFGYYKVHYFDVDYYVDWSKSVVNDGIFAAYKNLGDRLDYPPVFLFFLYPTGWMLNNPDIFNFEPYKMLALKMVQILFDVGNILLVYIVLKKQNKVLALFAASVWALNPALIFNCGVWGQTDSLMIFFLLLAFYLLEDNKPIPATVIYAIAGLTKFQSLYFAPLFLLLLFYKREIRKSLIAFGSGIATGIIIFFPFMLYSGITLPFEVYLGGAGKWQQLTFNAYNFYAAIGLNNVSDQTKVLSFLPLSVISLILTLIVVGVFLYLFITAKNKCPWILGFLLMQGFFIFGGRMHERYQIPVLIFLLIAAVRHRSGKLFGGFAAISIISFLNQFLLFDYICTFQKTAWAPYYDDMTIAISIFNVLLYFVTFYFCMPILYPKFKPTIPEDQQTEVTELV